jgi:hypothetical protein
MVHCEIPQNVYDFLITMRDRYEKKSIHSVITWLANERLRLMHENEILKNKIEVKNSNVS